MVKSEGRSLESIDSIGEFETWWMQVIIWVSNFFQLNCPFITNICTFYRSYIQIWILLKSSRTLATRMMLGSCKGRPLWQSSFLPRWLPAAVTQSLQAQASPRGAIVHHRAGVGKRYVTRMSAGSRGNIITLSHNVLFSRWVSGVPSPCSSPRSCDQVHSRINSHSRSLRFLILASDSVGRSIAAPWIGTLCTYCGSVMALMAAFFMFVMLCNVYPCLWINAIERDKPFVHAVCQGCTFQIAFAKFCTNFLSWARKKKSVRFWVDAGLNIEGRFEEELFRLSRRSDSAMQKEERSCLSFSSHQSRTRSASNAEGKRMWGEQVPHREGIVGREHKYANQVTLSSTKFLRITYSNQQFESEESFNIDNHQILHSRKTC